MASATLLLPAAASFGGQRLGTDAARALGRADRLPDAPPGRRALLRRHFPVAGGAWPIAALAREDDAGDAAGATWLRADPVHIRPDINGARLLAHGAALRLSSDDADAFLPALEDVFAEAGCRLDAPVPSRWYLRLPPATTLPEFSSPQEGLGEDAFEHLPDGADAGHWRRLLSESQVLLHQHPRNAWRSAQGLPVVNSLWFWGGGMLPGRGDSPHDALYSGDESAWALAGNGLRREPLAAFTPGTRGDDAYDLDDVRDLGRLQRDWLQPALAALHRGALDALLLDGADGRAWRLTPWQRLRPWKRPRRSFGE